MSAGIVVLLLVIGMAVIIGAIQTIWENKQMKKFEDSLSDEDKIRWQSIRNRL